MFTVNSYFFSRNCYKRKVCYTVYTHSQSFDDVKNVHFVYKLILNPMNMNISVRLIDLWCMQKPRKIGQQQSCAAEYALFQTCCYI